MDVVRIIFLSGYSGCVVGEHGQACGEGEISFMFGVII